MSVAGRHQAQVCSQFLLFFVTPVLLGAIFPSPLLYAIYAHAFSPSYSSIPAGAALLGGQGGHLPSPPSFLEIRGKNPSKLQNSCKLYVPILIIVKI